MRRLMIRRLRRPAIGLALGADSCRYQGLGLSEDVFQEPSHIVRRKDDLKIAIDESSIGDIATSTKVRCFSGLESNFEWRIRPLGHPPFVDEYILRCMLRYFGGRLAQRLKCRRPRRLFLTGRPDLLTVIQPFLEQSARGAGFRRWMAVDEADCFSMAAGINSGCKGATLVIDVGHSGARIYGWEGTRYLGLLAGCDTGGAKMAEAVITDARRSGLMIANTTAQRLLEASGDKRAWPQTCKGRDVETSLPRMIEVSYADIQAILRPSRLIIADMCQGAVADIGQRDGEDIRIFLAGGAGGCGLAGALQERIKGEIAVIPDPADASARGLARLFPQL